MDCAHAAVGLLLGTLRGGDSFRSPLVCKFLPSMASHTSFGLLSRMTKHLGTVFESCLQLFF
jgi:hypothetical protein